VTFRRPLDSSGTFNPFESFPSRKLFFIHGLSFAVPTERRQRLPSVYTYILHHNSFTRFLEHSGSMIHDIMYAASSRCHPSYHIILCPIDGDTLECSTHSLLPSSSLHCNTSATALCCLKTKRIVKSLRVLSGNQS
jgi:hypothetical protein